MKIVLLIFMCCFSLTLGDVWKQLDTDTQMTKSLAESVVKELDGRSNSLYKSTLENIVKVETKTSFLGQHYRLTLQLVKCIKGKIYNDLTDCKAKEVQECNVTILASTWRKNVDISDFQCGPFMPFKGQPVMKAKKPLLGGDDHDVGNYGMFQEFKQKYNKLYKGDKEEQERFEIFRSNMRKAKKLQDTEKGTAKYGATEFADMTAEEFRKTRLTPVWDVKYDPSLKMADIPEVTAPDAFDWRDHGAVTPVKNQGSCGSCWAFSTTGNIEGQWSLRKKKLVSLSEQELVDCDKLDLGCSGGLPTNAYKEIIRLGGLETEKEYPYEGRNDKCHFIKGDVRAYINGSLNISSNEEEMKAWLYKNGPISIGINANAMQFYFGGVSHPWEIFCNPDSLDHGVLIVGYGIEKGWFSTSPYWIVKNSWGGSWGEKGYYRVYRGAGVCGLNKMPTSATVG